MGTKGAEVIILSDDDEEEKDTPCGESSIYIVEPEDEMNPGDPPTETPLPVSVCVSVVLSSTSISPVFQALFHLPALWKKTWW